MGARQTRQSGQTAIMFTMGLTLMFGMVGLVSDVGYIYYRKQNATAAAQAAAAAAIKAAFNSSGGNFVCGSSNVECYTGYPPSYTCPTSISGNGANNLEVGCLYAAANGYSGAKVTFQAGTGSVEGVQATYWVIARVSENLPLLFSAVTGSMSTSLTARSVAAYIPRTSGGCIYVLAPSGSSFQTDGNGFLQTGCGVWDDSVSSNAINLNGANTYICVGTFNSSSNTCTASTTSKVNIVSNTSPEWTCGGSNSNCIQPTPSTGAANSGDPMAGLPTPTYDPSSCVSESSFHNDSSLSNPTGTLCITGGLNIQGGTLTLAAGTYVLTGCSGNSGLSTSGQGGVTGTGVTIYMTGGCSAQVTGNGSVTLSAPTSGTYQGVLFFQDPSDSTASYLTGGSSQILQGVAYFPDALLHYSGGSSSSNNNCGASNNQTCQQALSIVAYNLDIKGNSYIQSAGSSPYLTSYSGVAIIE